MLIRTAWQPTLGCIPVASQVARVPSAAANLVPSLLPLSVHDRHVIQIEIPDIDSWNVRSFVETGQAGLGIAGRPLSSAALTLDPLFRDRIKVVCSAGRSLVVTGRLVQWTDL